MTKKQKILNVLSLIIVIWNSIALVFKLLMLTLLLLATFAVANNSDFANSMANALNNSVSEIHYSSNGESYNFSFDEKTQEDNQGFKPKDNPDNENRHFMEKLPFGQIEGNITKSHLTGSDLQSLSAVLAVIIIVCIVITIFGKFLVIFTGALGIRASRKPEKAKLPFVLGCIISVFSAIEILLYVFAGGIGILFVIMPLIFIVFTVYLRIVSKDYEAVMAEGMEENVPESDTEQVNSEEENTEEYSTEQENSQENNNQ